MPRRRLPRFVAVWSDGVTRVIHAKSQDDAWDLAARLVAPQGVRVLHVEPIDRGKSEAA